MRRAPFATTILAALALEAQAQTPADSAPLLSTGITGVLTASGLASPTYALSFRPVQRLVLEAVAGPVSPARADELLRGTPVAADRLVDLGIFRREGDRLRLDYLVLTAEDQRAIYRVAERLGPDLARAIAARGNDFTRLVDRYPEAALRPALEFDLIAGMLLNWEGLALTTRLGYRAAPIARPNGDRYLFHSKERGAELPLSGLYWGSESWPGSAMTMTTFGDAESFPRLHGIPNVYDGPFDDGLASLREQPVLLAALRTQMLTYLGIANDDAGLVLARLAVEARPKAKLREALGLPAARFEATVSLLEALGYIRCEPDVYRLAVPVLIERDRVLVDSTLAIGRAVLTDWLERHNPELRRELAGLSPMKNGLPFELVFSEVWHYLFGFATKALAESGFVLDPRGPGRADKGYVPLVWANSLYRP